MAERWERFTERARRAMTLAQEEARRLRHNYVGTEHLLLGLMLVEDGVAARVLARLEVDAGVLRQAVERRIGPGHEEDSGELRLTPRLKRALERAWEEAKRLHHHYVGTEHQLLGLLREGEGMAVKLLEDLGVTHERAREEIIRVLSQGLESDLGLKRYTLVLPEGLFRDVQQLADREHTAVVEVLRRFIKLGLLVTRLQETPGAALIIREGDTERQLVLL